MLLQPQPQRQPHQPVGQVGGYWQFPIGAGGAQSLRRGVQRDVVEYAVNAGLFHGGDEGGAVGQVAQ